MHTPVFFPVGGARLRRLVSLAILGFWSALAVHAAAPVRKAFDVPADDAARALKQFAAQAGEQLLYSTSDVSGVRTLAVRGEMTPREALGRMSWSKTRRPARWRCARRREWSQKTCQAAPLNARRPAPGSTMEPWSWMIIR